MIRPDIRVNESQEKIISNRSEQTISLVLKEIDRLGIHRVGFEGCPIYAFPSSRLELKSQQYESEEFKNGWKLGDRLITQLHRDNPGLTIHHWVMVDDVNGIEGVPLRRDIFDRTIAAINRKIGLIEILKNTDPERSFLESQFIKDTKDECSILDARFQMLQITDAIKNIDPLQSILLKIHPIGFQFQQALMFQHMLKEMKTDFLFSKRSKQVRISLIESLFVHIWIDDEGKVSDITMPKFQESNSQFAFQKVISL